MADHPAFDTVPWSELAACYGPATRFPDLLRACAAGDEQAHDELIGEIWHQGTVYEATAFTVPFLAQIALEQPALRDRLIYDLGFLAYGMTFGNRQVPEELAHVAATRAAVLAHAPALAERVLEAPTPTGYVALARLATAFPDEQAPFAAALALMADDEQDIRVRLAALATPGHEEADPVLDDLWRELYYEQR